MPSDLYWVLAATVLVLTVLTVSLPACIYALYQLRLHWNEHYMQKRRPMIILALIVLTFCQTVVKDLFTSSLVFFQYHYITESIIHSIFVILLMLLGVLILLRIYLLYYDHEYERVLATKKWIIMIDPSVEQSNYFLLNKHKYGDHRYVVKRIIIPCFTVFIILYLLCRQGLSANANKKVYYLITAMTDFAALVVMCAITLGIGVFYWKKYPKFNDTLLIRKEIWIIVKLSILGTSMAIVTWLIVFTAIYLILFFYALMQFFWVIFLYTLTVYPQRYNYPQRTNSVSVNPSNIKWDQVISNQNGYETLANFLAKEFSIENLLFITEYVQIKREMMKHAILKGKMEDDLALNFNLDLPDHIPLSVIAKELQENISSLDGDSDISELQHICFVALEKMFCKYIDSRKAALEINISYALRNDFVNAFANNLMNQSVSNDNAIEVILPLMETACYSIAQLMNGSYGRFTRRDSFSKLELSTSSN